MAPELCSNLPEPSFFNVASGRDPLAGAGDVATSGKLSGWRGWNFERK